MSLDTNGNPNLVWIGSKDSGNVTVLCLKPDELCLATVPEQDAEKSAAALAAEDDVVAHTIPLEDITRLEGEERGNDLTITFANGDARPSTTVRLADNAARDEVLDVLQECLGPAWARERQSASRLRAVLWPLGLTIGITLLTAFMHAEAQELANGRKPPRVRGGVRIRILREIMRGIENLLGATGVLILGGILVMLCIVWFAHAVWRPSVRLIVQETNA